MEASDAYDPRIAEYLLNDMTEEERAAFEKEMAEDQKLALEVKWQRQMLDQLKATLAYKELIEDPDYEELDKLAKEIVADKPRLVRYSPGRRAMHLLLVAAQVAIFVIIGKVLLKDPTSAALFTQYYQPYEIEYEGNSEDPSQVIIAQSINFYNRGNYNQVITNLTRLDPGEELPAEATFSLGLAYLAVNDYTNAVLTFQEHIEQHEAYDEEANWYLALSFLKKGEPERARPIFSMLAGADNDFSKKASRILRRIDRMKD
jgi:TolA-binding protein